MQIRAFSNHPYWDGTSCADLANHFNLNTLNSFHDTANGGVYRRPCLNCQSLLPVLDVPIVGQWDQRNYYDGDLDWTHSSGIIV